MKWYYTSTLTPPNTALFFTEKPRLGSVFVTRILGFETPLGYGIIHSVTQTTESPFEDKKTKVLHVKYLEGFSSSVEYYYRPSLQYQIDTGLIFLEGIVEATFLVR